MSEEDCPTCKDHPPQGQPVRGNEDVFAYATPMPPDDQLTSWSTPLAMVQPATEQGARVELLGGIPQPPRDMAGPTLSTTSTPPRPMAEFTSPQRIIHDRVLQANGAQVEYLLPLGAPWFDAGVLALQEDKPLEMPPKEGDGTKPDEEEEPESEEAGKPFAGRPEEGIDYPSAPFKETEHQDVKKRPPKGGGPVVVLPGQDKAKDFRDEWDESDAWLPDGPVLLACPTEVEHKVNIWWVDSKDIGWAESRSDAERLASGAMESNDAEEILDKSVSSGVLEQKVNAFLDDRGWTCAPKCKRQIELSGYLYQVQVMTEILRGGLKDGKEGYFVGLYVVHQLFAWVKIKCIL